MSLVHPIVRREVAWAIAAPFRLLYAWPRLCASVLALVAVTVYTGQGWWLVPFAGAALALVVWARSAPAAFDRCLGRPWERITAKSRLQQRWDAIAVGSGLARMDRNRVSLWNPDRRLPDRSVAPALKQVRWHGRVLHAEVRLLPGQAVDDLRSAAEAIRHAVCASSCRVVLNDRRAELRVVFGDALRQPFEPVRPTSTDLRALPMGRDENGASWHMRVGPHTLVAGASGSGKASLVWGYAFGLAPAAHEGWVQIHGVDLKGGMELALGRALLTRYAHNANAAVTLLEDAVAAMSARALRLAGTTRQHTPSVDEPHVVVLIDELAALTAYLTDRDLTRRANAAIALLCSQGRAVGYTVFACLQDPRKETIPVRGLFTQMVGLRLKDREETSMVLGDAARQAGAACHQIAATTPGVGYVVPEDGGAPRRVRGALITDDDIRRTASRYPAPFEIPVVPKAVEPSGRSPRRRVESVEADR